MIKAINISPLNTTNELYTKCKYCGSETTIKLENSLIRTDNEGSILSGQDTEFECVDCGKSLKD